MRKEDLQQITLANWTFVYSAFYDVEKPDVVKIVGSCQRGYPGYFCHLWYREKNESIIKMAASNATVHVTSDRRDVIMSSNCYILCPVEENWSPFAVSIVVGNKCSPANNMIEVTYIGKTNYTRNFTMCLSPFYDIDDADRLLQWIEFNRILGADNFLLYNFTGGPNLHKVLHYYIKQGLVQVFQWPLPISDGGRHFYVDLFDDYMQGSAYNDCLLRSKATSRYVVITDFDEFIVPHVKGAKTWTDMLQVLPKANAYTFRNCFFHIKNVDDFKYPEKEIALKYNISALLALKRDKVLFHHGKRSKYITRTNSSFNLLTHYQRGAKTYPVDAKIGFLHHYRKKKIMGDTGTNVVIDKIVLTKYGQELAAAAAKAWSNIRK